jgi:hypothetical protein
MSDITKALKDEEDALLRSIDEDPGHLDQISAVIAARSGWVALVLLAAQTVLFLAGAWAAWNFFKATDALLALRWGLPAGVLLIASLMLKLALWPAMQAQRQLQALKRIELRILAAKGA